jgi:hypothetical protein
MTAALVGWYVELAKLEPAFPAPHEHPDEALARVKPILVILIDSQFEEGMSDLLAARATKRGVGIALFGTGSEGDDERARLWATEHKIMFFRLPIDLEAFGRVLDQTVRSVEPERRIAQRRSEPAVERAVDGTLLLHEASGATWYVYDRRGGDRRIASRPYRAFINADGVERRCELNDPEFAARQPAALVDQLARSAQVPPYHSYP